jgi:hypothetical protein
MSTIISGVVAKGVIVPDLPLPEGTVVEIHVGSPVPQLPQDLREEFDDWERAGAGTIELVERLADEIEVNEKR